MNKYRIWARGWKPARMIEPKDIQLFGSKNLQEALDTCKNETNNKYGLFILMVSTGLYDINDKEIFESDIVKVISYGRKSICLVEYGLSAEGFKFNYKVIGGIYERNEIILNNTKFEIIGNKYKNPELLA